MEYNIKSIREDFKAKGVFYTDTALAERLKALVGSCHEVYDPTCGSGNLLAVFDDDVKKYGQELNPEQLQVCRERLKNFEGVSGDTLVSPAFMEHRFEAIVANPPFSVKWNPQPDERFMGAPCLPPPSKADYAFLLHILYLLADNGRAAVLNFPGVLYRGQREGSIRRWFVEKNVIERVECVPGGHFVDTSIATCIIVLNKAKSTTDIVMCDVEKGKERTVSIDEIRSNDYNLSVNSYIVEETPVKVVDLWELECKARAAAVKRIKAEIEFSIMVSRFEGWDVSPFLDELKDVIDSFR
ncbi:MAG: N-6 DNA methylase [Muribaculaceae bacterium]|nr:N-6 DNA methylase [Muribaculaceae bacterium]